MAKAELILQALTKDDHAAAMQKMLSLPKPEHCILSVAFVRSEGIDAIRSSLAGFKIKPRVFVGIRNGITSVQALHELLKLKVELYTVDTGSRRPIFHPKLYLIAAKNMAAAIIGSANLTHYGLHNNIEASALLHLDLASPEDAKFVKAVLSAFENLIKDYPDHVKQIGTAKQADNLFEQGRLCDEAVVVAPSSSQQASAADGSHLPPMKLNFWPASTKKQGAKQLKPKGKSHSVLSKTQFVRVWRSKPLTQRDLNVPEGENTNPTGSIGLKQDAVEEFDFQTHFRKSVFGELKWKAASSHPLKEEAIASFQFLIENVDYGVFALKLAHDNRADTASYKQGQFMTQLHWGAAKPIIARKDLLGRTLALYKKSSKPPEYLIEID